VQKNSPVANFHGMSTKAHLHFNRISHAVWLLVESCRPSKNINYLNVLFYFLHFGEGGVILYYTYVGKTLTGRPLH
jgi:hypothetical protein